MIHEDAPLLLGSASPRRRELLSALGLPFGVAVADIDETPMPAEDADAYLVRIVAAKLEAVRRSLATSSWSAILVADTSVILDGCVLGKPSDEGEARRMIASLAGRGHEVWTRFAVARLSGAPSEPHAETVRSNVFFRALDDDEIAAYAATGEGIDKAGAYAIQGIGGFAVSRIEGSYSNIVGLPVCEVVVALRSLGLLRGFPRRP
jgi:septum formation protein